MSSIFTVGIMNKEESVIPDVVARISKETADWLEAHDRGRLEDDYPAYEFGYNLTVADMRKLAALKSYVYPERRLGRKLWCIT